MPKTRAVLLFPLALAACMTPTSRVEAGLENAGLKPRLARCMAPRMTDRLSIGQLRQLAGLPKASRSHSLDQLLHRLRALGDPEILQVTSKAAIDCEIDHVL